MTDNVTPPAPSSFPSWATNGGATQEAPIAGKVQTGWILSEKPSHKIMNWLFARISDWLNYAVDGLDDVQAQVDQKQGLEDFTTIKAAVRLDTTGAGATNIQQQHNVSSVGLTATKAVVNLTIAMNTVKPYIALVSGSSNTLAAKPVVSARNASSVEIQWVDAAGTVTNPQTIICAVDLIVVGTLL